MGLGVTSRAPGVATKIKSPRKAKDIGMARNWRLAAVDKSDSLSTE
jgi:hypothetical protein